MDSTNRKSSWSDPFHINIREIDPPIVQLIYPTGGEILSGITTVQWFAQDDHDPNLDIYI